MTDLEMNIRDGIELDMTDSEIAEWLDIPVAWIHEFIETYRYELGIIQTEDYSDDSDALKSAGWGTDEDYGGDCEYL